MSSANVIKVPITHTDREIVATSGIEQSASVDTTEKDTKRIGSQCTYWIKLPVVVEHALSSSQAGHE